MAADLPKPSPLRVRRAPTVEEPYDDELTDSMPPTVGALALALPGLDRRPSLPLHLVPPARAERPAPGPLPPVGPLATRLAQAMAEVLAGGRSPAQLAAHTTLSVLSQLERWSGRLVPRRHGRGSDLPAARPRVTSVHLSQPTPRSAEVCVVVDTGQRRRALAFRLDARGGAWRCTALQLG